MASDSKGRKLPPLEKKMSAYELKNIKRRDDASAKKAIKKMVENRNPRKNTESFYAYNKRINKLIANNQTDSKPEVKKPEVKKTEVKKTEVKKTEVKKTTPSFGKAFADARRSGKKTFMWNGKSYTTKRADDKAKTPIKSQDAKPNPSNAPRPDYTSKRVEKKDGNKKTNIKKSVNKKSVNKKSTLDKVKDVIGIGRPATKKEKMGRSLQRKAQASMGFKKGGRVGGCKVDGIAIRGRTRARHK
tara:strand:+ start:29 stop:760 length:732 start_codon:yes stop_codon:yes gene_type:complete